MGTLLHVSVASVESGATPVPVVGTGVTFVSFVESLAIWFLFGVGIGWAFLSFMLHII